MGGIEYRTITPEALVPEWSLLQLATIAVVMIAFVGFVEELLFRGVLQAALADRLGTWPGIVLASVIFGLMHAGSRPDGAGVRREHRLYTTTRTVSPS